MILKNVILLQIFIAATVHAGKTALAAVKGKDCIAIVENAYTEIVNGDLDSASEKLKGLESDAEELARVAKEMAEEMERLERQHKQKAEDIQRNISDLHAQEISIKNYKSGLEATLAKERNMLSEHENELSKARSALDSARWRFEKAEKDQNERRGAGAAIGAILGTIFLPGFGTVIGGGLGLGAGQIINELIDDKDKAERRVNRATQECNNGERRIDSTKAEISSTTNEIDRLLHMIQELERLRSQFNSEATKMKEAMQFCVRASYFWKECREVSNHGADRTALLQRLINKAKEKESLEFLKSHGSERTAMTFLEAWEVMMNKYMEGSDFMPQISHERSEL